MLIERGIAATAAQAEMCGVTLVAAPVELLVLRGNGDSLVTAFMSVLGNAVRYTQRGGRVQVSWALEGSEQISVRVDDDGPGILPTEYECIFEPFVRGASGCANSESIGLGLTIARRLCEHNAAQLTVSSSPLGGARFSFVFDLIQAQSC